MKDVNLLHELFLKSSYALNSAKIARHAVRHPAGLWYHAIGLLNAFYALNEEMEKRTKNTKDNNLVEAVTAWRTANKTKIDSFFENARNIVTHQGKVKLEFNKIWEIDHINDTEFPVPIAHITIKNTEITQLTGTSFIDRCIEALKFMHDGIKAIDADYRIRGGKQHSLPLEKNNEELF